MSQEVTELRDQTQKLMDGPLKHIRAAALAAALIPLASVFAAPASAQTGFASGGILSGTVYNDTNASGTQEIGEPGLAGIAVQILCTGCPISDTITVYTDANGLYVADVPDATLTYTVAILTPTGFQPSPTGGGSV